MNYSRVHSLLSRATEAIVTSDGKIKRRLNSYETVVEPGKNDPFYIPEDAVNDNYGNLNYLTSKIRNRSVSVRLSQLRYAMYAAFTLVVILFSWSAYNFLIPNISATGEYNKSTGADDDLATTMNETQLERVANLIIGDNDWNKTRVTLFIKHWNASSDEAREFFKTTAWFQHFSYRLETTFNRAIYTGELFGGDSTTEKHPVYSLALAVGVADPEINYAANIEKNKNYMKLETAVATELAKMEESKLQDNTQDSQMVADEMALAKLLTDTNGDPLLPVAPKEPAGDSAKQSSNNVVEQITPKQEPAAIVVAAAPPAISEQDVSRVFQKYASAYESGNISELSSLFGVDDPTQGNRIIEQLKSNYENIFSNSHKRTVNFQGINWRFDGNQATVNSDYSSQIELKNNKGTQTITAYAKVDLEKKNNDLIISNFELLNRSVSVVTPELTIPSTKRGQRELPVNPTPAELQDIVTRLVSSYESGDLESFSNLFAPNAKTNDRQDLKGIKSDYAELFKGSNDRQMFIQGMQWTFDENYAKGTGDLEAIVLTESGNSVYSMGGKIQLVAQRIDGKVRITHMYHIERKK
ncbi:YybH family protein [Kaarinaea lacus]